MRLDKYLKASRIIKRRTIAQSACEGGLVLVNGTPKKSSAQIKEGDIIEVKFGKQPLTVRVKALMDTSRKDEAASMYEVISS